MASTYQNISFPEMRGFLQEEKGWRHPEIEIKVYSGILAGNNQSRGCGKDAIRVCAVHVGKHIGWIKASRVYRVHGWKENLKERVLQVIKQAKGRINQYGT